MIGRDWEFGARGVCMYVVRYISEDGGGLKRGIGFHGLGERTMVAARGELEGRCKGQETRFWVRYMVGLSRAYEVKPRNSDS